MMRMWQRNDSMIRAGRTAAQTKSAHGHAIRHAPRDNVLGSIDLFGGEVIPMFRCPGRHPR